MRFNLNLEIDDDLKKYLVSKKEKRDGIQYIFDFGNEYGASVIKFSGSYGYRFDKWEVACLFDGKMFYPDLVEGDVIGHLTDKRVNELLKLIKDEKFYVPFWEVQDE